MVFAPKSKHVDDLNVKIQNTNIERVSVTKFLGVMIDAQLSWKCHIKYTCKKINTILYCRKKLIRIITCSPYRAHSKPLLVANNELSVSEINVYMVGILMYTYCNDNVPDIFSGFFQRNRELHDRNTRQSNDFHVRFARLYVRKFSLRIHGATIWSDIPLYIKHASSLNIFKQMLRKHLIYMNVHGIVTQF